MNSVAPQLYVVEAWALMLLGVLHVFSVAGGILGRAGLLAWIVVLGIVVPLTALSFSRTVNR